MHQPDFYGGALWFDGSDTAAVLERWRTWSATLPEAATTSFALFQLPAQDGIPEPLAGRLTVSVRYVWTGTPADGERALAGMRAAAPILIDDVAVKPYTEIDSVHNDPLDPMPVREHSILLDDFPAPAVEALMSAVGPRSGSRQILVEVRQLGGAYTRGGDQASAFDPCHAAYAVLAVGLPGEETEVDHDVLRRALAPWALPERLPRTSPSPRTARGGLSRRNARPHPGCAGDLRPPRGDGHQPSHPRDLPSAWLRRGDPMIPQLYPYRGLDSARTTLELLPGYRLRATIEHAPLEGVTPDMLLWWFRNIGGSMPYAGQHIERYLVWHPRDHVSWRLARPGPNGSAEEGARFHIRENLLGDPMMRIDSTERVEKLDRTGIRLVLRIAGAQFFQLEHTWSEGRGRTHYVSVLDLGARSRFATLINAYLRSKVLSPAMAQAWLQHNVEEVGRLEHFLPGLYTAQHRRGGTRDDQENGPRSVNSREDPPALSSQTNLEASLRTAVGA